MKRAGRILVAVLAFITLLVVGRYLTFIPDVFFPQQKAVYLNNETALYLHIIAGMIALLIGTLLLFQKIQKHKKQHILRNIYIASILFGGVGGLMLAQTSFGGLITHIGFSLLAVGWLVCGSMMIKSVREKNHHALSQWFLRSYALTFAAVMLRLWTPALSPLLGFDVAYQMAAWLCWVPNLVVMEYMLRRRNHAQQLSKIKA